MTRSREPLQPDSTHLGGETVAMPDRVIVAPSVGIYRPPSIEEGKLLPEGGILGTIESPGQSVDVISPFTGHLLRFMAADGERVREGQPLVWLRITEPG